MSVDPTHPGTPESSADAALAQLRTVIDSLNEGLVVATLEGDLIYWNKSALRMHGFATVEEVQGQIGNFTKIYELREMNGRTLPLENWPLSRILRGEKLQDCRLNLIRLDLPDWTRIYSYGGAIAAGDGGRPPLALVTIADVTLSHRAEVVLRESELRFRGLFEQAFVGIAQLDASGRYMRVNDRLCEMLGYTRDELLRLTFEDVTHADDREKDRQNQIRILASDGDRYATDKRYVRKDGSLIWSRLSVSAVRRTDGELDHFISVVEDINDLVLTQQHLQDKKQELQLALDAAELGLWNHDIRTDLASLDERARRHFGADHSPMSRRELLERVHEADLDRTVEEVGRKLDFATSNGRYVNEYRIRQADGTYRWIRVEGRVIFSNDPNPIAIRRIGTSHDITDLRTAADALRVSEERHRQAVEAAQMGTWKLDYHTRVFHLDDRCRDHHDLIEVQVDYERLMQAVHPEDRAMITRKSRAASDPGDGSGHLKFEYRRLRPDGSERWLAIESRVFFVGEGTERRADMSIGTSRDITEQKRAEQDLRAAKEAAEAFAARAEAASQAKDRFLAALSHELRTPLNPVRLMAHALESDPELPPRIREDLQLIQRNVEIETRLIDDLLDISRFARGKFLYEPVPTNVHEILKRVLETCRDEEVVRKGLSLVLESTATNVSVMADPTRLHQIFWNLIRNATKFTTQGGSVVVRSFNPDAGRITVSVADTGIGIEKSLLSIIFNPFEQGSVDHHRRFGGLGLGLAIVKALVDLHGGTVRAESAGPGRGATFTIELPLANSALQSLAEPRKEFSRTRMLPVRPLRILVIEDHTPTALVVRRLLEQRGHAVVTAHTARAARQAARDGSFDLVLSDIGLPDGSGHSLFAELKASYGFKGIAISGYGMEEDREMTHAAGFAALLVKPITTEQLDAALSMMFPSTS